MEEVIVHKRVGGVRRPYLVVLVHGALILLIEETLLRLRLRLRLLFRSSSFAHDKKLNFLNPLISSFASLHLPRQRKFSLAPPRSPSSARQLLSRSRSLLQRDKAHKNTTTTNNKQQQRTVPILE